MFCLKSQKHAPSGIIELKEVTNVTEVLSDGTFQVSLYFIFQKNFKIFFIQITTPNRTYEIRGGQ